jgi:L-threonine kinase
MSATGGLTVVAEAIARVPATCGELLQGVDDERGPVLVSLPVAVPGTVAVALMREPLLQVTPDLPRARAALRLALDLAGWRGGAMVRLGGEVPRGRGMGSSTVDVAGVIGAVLGAAGVALSPATLARTMAAVEPSDSSPLPGLWAMDHVSGRWALALGDAPAGWRLVAVDSAVGVDTLAIHRELGPGPRLPAGTLTDTVAAASRRDTAALARIATESARRNQERLPHPAYAAVCAAARSVRAAGVCVAHSGSLCAVICTSDAQARMAASALHANGLRTVTWTAAALGMQVDVTEPWVARQPALVTATSPDAVAGCHGGERDGGRPGVHRNPAAPAAALSLQRSRAAGLPVRARASHHGQ